MAVARTVSGLYAGAVGDGANVGKDEHVEKAQSPLSSVARQLIASLPNALCTKILLSSFDHTHKTKREICHHQLPPLARHLYTESTLGWIGMLSCAEAKPPF
ncbi:hypothetical protein C2S51_015698 [Perilla frutescens var. frutescens]|nr:hypothetical protein C2S51_015698 [Perilla frutescens var. frutescens]